MKVWKWSCRSPMNIAVYLPYCTRSFSNSFNFVMTGMEAVVQTTNQEEVESAAKTGASIISVVGKLKDEAVQLLKLIPEEVLSFPFFGSFLFGLICVSNMIWSDWICFDLIQMLNFTYFVYLFHLFSFDLFGLISRQHNSAWVDWDVQFAREAFFRFFFPERWLSMSAFSVVLCAPSNPQTIWLLRIMLKHYSMLRLIFFGSQMLLSKYSCSFGEMYLFNIL